ncbi:MAG: hypothetical protein OXQ31_25560 [Spirochaetaceae bacterium]|nr:hypothetical protein [Spirochaetaceae bacterium]
MAVPRWLFIVAALLWLPMGVAITAPLRGLRLGADAGPWPMTAFMIVSSLVVVAPAGLPLALACRRLWRLGRHVAAWVAFAMLAIATVAASLLAGLLGPLAIAVSATVMSVPVWIAVLVLGRRRV